MVLSTYDECQDEDRDEEHEVYGARDSPVLVEHFLALRLWTNQKPAVVSERRSEFKHTTRGLAYSLQCVYHITYRMTGQFEGSKVRRFEDRIAQERGTQTLGLGEGFVFLKYCALGESSLLGLAGIAWKMPVYRGMKWNETGRFGIYRVFPIIITIEYHSRKVSLQ